MQVTMSTTMTQIRFQDMTRPTKIGKLIKYLDFSITTWRTYQTLCSAFLYITLKFFMKPDELEHLDLSLIRNLPVVLYFWNSFITAVNYVLIEDDEQINEITDYMVKEKKNALKIEIANPKYECNW